MDEDRSVCFLPLPNSEDVDKDPFNPLNQMIIQMAIILLMSHIFYLLLKPLGQTAPIAQILSGMVLSPALLSRIGKVNEFFIQTSSASYYKFIVFLFRTCFMFLVGLETDFGFMRRNLRKAGIIALGGMLGCGLLAAIFSWFVILQLKLESNSAMFGFVFSIILSGSASPVVYRVITEMKLDTSNIGRLAICSSLILELSLVALYTVVLSFSSGDNFKNFLLSYFFTLALIMVNKELAPWFSTWYPNEKHMSKAQVLFFAVYILVLSSFIESRNLSSALPIFLIGFMFPRGGKAYRTLLQRLRFPVHEFVFPVYFGYIGYRFSVTNLKNRHHYLVLVLTTLFSVIGKIMGVTSACYYLKIPFNYNVFLSCILTMKGHFELLLLDINSETKAMLGLIAHDLFVTSLVMVTLVSGVFASFWVKQEHRSFAHTQTTFEFHTDEELRTLSCVYDPRHTIGALSLISALSGTQQAPFTPLLMHLVELPTKRKKANLKYHELEEGGEFSDEDDYGATDALDINDSVDSFTKETKIFINQVKVVSSLSNMYDDLCNGAEDLRVSIVFLPFHKHQRIDGKIKNDGEGIRSTNQKVLRDAPCSVGIFMERSLTGFQQPHGCELVQTVATLFFGGPHDREALALSRRLSMHPQVHLTLVRFMASTFNQQEQIRNSSHNNDEVLMSIFNEETENERDNNFLSEFYNRYVTSGQVGYEERRVEDGGNTLRILQEMGEMYSLFVIGKGRGDSPVTTGMRDWEECPELGPVGDLLTSSELNIKASVLVVQRYRRCHENPFQD